MIALDTRPEVVSVIGGGFSFADVDHMSVEGIVIAINDAAVWLKRPVNYVLSMDRLWTEYRWDWLITHKLPFYCRETCLQNIPDRARPFVNIFDNDSKSSIMSDYKGRLNGTNSGQCAINLAYQLKPHKLHLYGFDMCRSKEGRPYWFADYPWAPGGATKAGKYVEWASQFADMAHRLHEAGIETTNMSPWSKITAFKKIQKQPELA